MTTERKMTHYECVGEFHDTFGHPQKEIPYITFFKDEPQLGPFRMSLMREELKEFKDALEQNDILEMADALCDLLYVTYGTGHCLGMNLDNLLRASSLTIEIPNNLETKVNRNIINDCPDVIKDGLKNVCEMLDQFEYAYEIHDYKKMEGYLMRLLYATYSYGHILNFNMNLMFREVHASNMTKVCNNKEDAKESVRRYIEEGRYSDPQHRQKGNYYVVYDASTSKILKNYKWRKPNLEQFM
tara:strand:- start:322 stop:1047 length:726 start_codon:yes stop_codon:yes gene_type:complete